MAGLFLLPILGSLFWIFFLNYNDIPLKKGTKGFIYILSFSVLLAGILIILLWITSGQNLKY